MIELLVVIAVIGILGGMTMFALRGVQEDAIVARTRSTIRKIETVLNQRMEEYLHMSPPVVIYDGSGTVLAESLPFVDPTATPPIIKGARFAYPGGGLESDEPDAITHARIRLQLLRSKMIEDMPDCAGDVFTIAGNNLVFRPAVAFETPYLIGGFPRYAGTPRDPNFGVTGPGMAVRTGIYNAIVTRSQTMDASTAAFQQALRTAVAENLNAELLFLVIETSYTAGSYGVESFNGSEIADTDGDGLREFVDGYGNPIRYVRWPSGWDSDLIESQTPSSSATPTVAIGPLDPDPYYADVVASYNQNNGTSVAVSPGGDAFDRFQVDLGRALYGGGGGASYGANIPSATLLPLVVSGGRDGAFGLRFGYTGDNAMSDPFNGSPTALFSALDVAWSPGGTLIRWPDPYHPRPMATNTSTDPQTLAEQNRSLGGVFNAGIDGLVTNDLTQAETGGANILNVGSEIIYWEPTGLDFSNGVNFRKRPAATLREISGDNTADFAKLNDLIRSAAQDNISNFDGVSASQ